MPVLSLFSSTESRGITWPCLASVLPEVMVVIESAPLSVLDLPLLQAATEIAINKKAMTFFIMVSFEEWYKQELCKFVLLWIRHKYFSAFVSS